MYVARRTRQTRLRHHLVEILQVARHLLPPEGVPQRSQRVVVQRLHLARHVHVDHDAGRRRNARRQRPLRPRCRQRPATRAAHHGHMARGHGRQPPRRGFQEHIQAMHPFSPVTEIEVHAPARIRQPHLGMHLLHVLTAHVHPGLTHPTAIAVHMHPRLGHARRKSPARNRQAPMRKTVDVLSPLLPRRRLCLRLRAGPQIARRRPHILEARIATAQQLVELPNAAKLLRQVSLKPFDRSRAVVRHPVGRPPTHAALEIGEQMVHFAQQGDALDFGPVGIGQLAQPVQQRLRGLHAPGGDISIGARESPRVGGNAKVGIHRQRALLSLQQIVGIARQNPLQRRIHRKVRGKQIQHHRAGIVLDRSHQAIDALRVNLPGIALRPEQLQQRRLQRVAQAVGRRDAVGRLQRRHSRLHQRRRGAPRARAALRQIRGAVGR